MPIYPEDSKQMVLDLINRSNPSLPVALTAANTGFVGTPEVIPVVGIAIQNTSLVVLARPMSGYVGDETFTYRRLSLTSYFRGMTPEVIKYSPAAVGVSPYRFSDLLADFNLKFGFTLTMDDVVDVAFPAGQGDGGGSTGSAARSVLTTVKASPGSLAFTDSFVLRWTQEKERITQLIPGNDLGGRAYPGGIASGTTPKPQGEFLFYGLDCTSMATQLAALNGVTFVAPGSTAQQQLIAFLAAARPDLNISNAASTVAGGLAGCTLTTLALPSATAPVGNSVKFANVAVLTALAGSWFQGKLYLHYNPH